MKRWLPFACWLLLIAVIVACADLGRLRAFFDWYETLHPLADKAGHIGLIGMLTLLFDHALAGRKIKRVCIPLAPAIVFLVMTVEEVSQRWMPLRSFDLTDLAANYAGILVAVMVGRFPMIRRNRRACLQ